MDRDDETLLVKRLAEKDEEALRQVIDTYGGSVFGIARRVLAEPGLAEEVAQDTFLALWNRPSAYDPARGGLQGFLLGVARNKAIDRVRREESRRRAMDSLLAEQEATSTSQSDDEHLIQMEDSEEIRSALAKLSDVQRQAVVLAYFGGRTYREVAEELGIPEGTAKTRLRDALMRMRDELGGSRDLTWS